MLRMTLAVCIALSAWSGVAAAETKKPADMVILTVAGMIGKTNRGPLDKKRDSQLASQKIDFKSAYAFDRAMLLGLEQGTVTVQPPELDKPATFSGPLLRDVLGAVEASRGKLTIRALNGYSGWLADEDVASSDWILALTQDGKPLGLEQQGPIWILNTRKAGEKAADDAHGHWVWGVFYIQVGGE